MATTSNLKTALSCVWQIKENAMWAIMNRTTKGYFAGFTCEDVYDQVDIPVLFLFEDPVDAGEFIECGLQDEEGYEAVELL